MTLTVEAVFENGVLRPLDRLSLDEHQKVRLLVQTDSAPTAPTLKRWHWREAQAIEDGFTGEVAEELIRQRSQG
jgi:predicted DNA-binding antitoxin AbrB/MazE fold protein